MAYEMNPAGVAGLGALSRSRAALTLSSPTARQKLGISGLASGSGAGHSPFATRPRPRAGTGIGAMRAHVAPGEMILPREALARDAGLRYRAARSMAAQGRDPRRYTVGAGNSVNPRTGAPEFADYVNGQWVDPATGQAADFSSPFQQDSHEASAVPGSASASYGPQANGFSSPFPSAPPTDDQARLDALNAGLRSLGAALSANARPSDQVMADLMGDRVPLEQAQQDTWNQRVDLGHVAADDPRVVQANAAAGRSASRANESAIIDPLSPATSPTTDLILNGGAQQAQLDADLHAGAGGAPSFEAWGAPLDYAGWRETRNPSGKNVPNILYGQVSGTGYEQSPFGQTFGASTNALSGQMPAQLAAWSLPGTSALGMSRDGGSNEVSILNNGYRGGDSMSIVAPGLGGGVSPTAGWLSPFGNPSGGLSGSFLGGASGSTTGTFGRPPDFRSAFRY